MNKLGLKHARGFSLVELVIVIVVVGLLAVAALPRFLNITDEAKVSSIEGVAGGFATAVLSVRAQWEADGRPEDPSGYYVVNYDGTDFRLTDEDDSSDTLRIRSGYPVGVSDDGFGAEFTLSATDCATLMTELMQNPPQTATTTDYDATEHKYLAVANTDDVPTCFYYQMASASNTPSNLAGAHYFTYEPTLGRVKVNLAQ